MISLFLTTLSTEEGPSPCRSSDARLADDLTMCIIVRPIETERPKYRPDLFPSLVFQLLQRHPGRTILRQERQNLGFRILRQI